MLLTAFQRTQPDDALKRAKEYEGGEGGVVGVEEGRGVRGRDGDQLEHWLLLEQEGGHLPRGGSLVVCSPLPSLSPCSCTTVAAATCWSFTSCWAR